MKTVLLTFFIATGGSQIQVVPVDTYENKQICEGIAETLTPIYLKETEQMSREMHSSGVGYQTKIKHTCTKLSPAAGQLANPN